MKFEFDYILTEKEFDNATDDEQLLESAYFEHNGELYYFEIYKIKNNNVLYINKKGNEENFVIYSKRTKINKLEKLIKWATKTTKTFFEKGDFELWK